MKKMMTSYTQPNNVMLLLIKDRKKEKKEEKTQMNLNYVLGPMSCKQQQTG